MNDLLELIRDGRKNDAGILLAFEGNEGSQYQLLALGAVLIFAALLNGLTLRRYGGTR